MGTKTNHRLHVIEGRPWKEALICALTPDASYRPWHGVGDVEPGDAVLVVIDTEPQTVLCAFIQGSDPVRRAITRTSRFGHAGLPTVTEVETAADGHRLSDGLRLDSPAAAALVKAASGYSMSQPHDRVGDSSVAAARILLQSEGRCGCCGEPIDLAGSAPAELGLHLVSDNDFEQGQDWPALLCLNCQTGMEQGGFGSVVDYAYSLHPACPECSARRSRGIAYGMPTYDGHMNQPPWWTSGGCVVDSSVRWVCAECGCSWGPSTERNAFADDPQRYEFARTLFGAWTGVTNPELLAALWKNLNTADLNHWLQLTEPQLEPRNDGHTPNTF